MSDPIRVVKRMMTLMALGGKVIAQRDLEISVLVRLAIGRLRRCVRGCLWGSALGSVGSLNAMRTGVAQDRGGRPLAGHIRAAAGRDSMWAGVHVLDTDDLVYVPERCIGPRRCPLVVGGALANMGPLAEQYGMLLLLEGGAYRSEVQPGSLAEVLRKFAVDTNKIGLVENSTLATSGPTKMFSRFVTFTGMIDTVPARAPKQGTEYLLMSEAKEIGRNLALARTLRARGYSAKVMAHFTWRDYDFMTHWLVKSWELSKAAAQVGPATLDDPPLLSEEVVSQLTAFWNRFQQEPDSIQFMARPIFLREVLLPFGTEQVSVVMDDMAALAAHYPSVAADLEAAGLTARQHDAYRAALAGAYLVNAGLNTSDNHTALPPASGVAKNAAFLTAHPKALTTLQARQMWLRMWTIFAP